MNYQIVNNTLDTVPATANFSFLTFMISFSTMYLGAKVAIYCEEDGSLCTEKNTVEDAIAWVIDTLKAEIDNAVAEKAKNTLCGGHYSELQVLKSAAGFYVGTLYTQGEYLDGKLNDTPGLVEPGSRDSHYFGNAEEAGEYLAYLNSQNDAPSEFDLECNSERMIATGN